MKSHTHVHTHVASKQPRFCGDFQNCLCQSRNGTVIAYSPGLHLNSAKSTDKPSHSQSLRSPVS